MHRLFLPALHAYCHNSSCRIKFGPRFILGIGIEDGENAERYWSRLPFAAHTRYMRPETRRDFITTHCHFLSENAYLNLVPCLKRKFKNAKKILSAVKTTSLSYSGIKSEIEKSKNSISKSNVLSSKEEAEESLFALARTVFRCEKHQKRSRGTKISATVATGIRKATSCLSENVSAFNSRFSTNLTVKSILDGAKNSSKDALEDSIDFWKAIEQLYMIEKDVNTADKTLVRMNLSLSKKLDLETDPSKILLMEERVKLNDKIRSDLIDFRGSLSKTFISYEKYQLK